MDKTDEGFLQQVLAAVGAGLIVLSGDGAIVLTNQTAERLLELPAEAAGALLPAAGTAFLDADGAPLPAAELPWILTAADGTARSEVVRLSGPDGETALAFDTEPLVGGDGAVIGVAVGVRREQEPADRVPWQAIADINETLDSRLEPEEMLSRVLATTADALQADSAVLLRPTHEGWRVTAACGTAELLLSQQYPEEERPVTARAFATGQPVAVPDTLLDSDLGPGWVAHHDVRSVLAVPVDVHGDPEAVLVFESRRPEVFTPAHVGFAERLSRSVSLALGSAALIGSLREELEHTRLLQEVATVAGSNPEIRLVCSRVLKSLARHLGLIAGDIRVLSPDRGLVKLMAAVGYPEDVVMQIHGTPMSAEALLGELTLQQGRPAAATVPLGWAGAQLDGGRSVVVPIDFRKRIVGALTLVFEERRPFGDEELQLYEAVAHTLGQAIETSRLLDAEKEARRRASDELAVTHLLRETAEELSRPLELDELCDTFAGVLSRVSGRSRVVVALTSGRTRELVVRAVRGGDTGAVGRGRLLDDMGEAYQIVLERDEPYEVDVRHHAIDDMDMRRAAEHGGVRALIAPIRYRGELIGMATIDEPGDDAPFAVRERELVQSVVSQSAALIQNARSYESEHRIAETLQETLLLMPDRIPGVEFGTLYRSATAAARVGGDFYDIFEVVPGQVAVVVGDVSGKGLDAASVTALARNAFRIFATQSLAPEDVMERTNDCLRRFTSPETFVTAFFGITDTRTGALRYVCAGHPDGMVVGRGGYVHPLGCISPLLGALDDVNYSEQVTMLAPTDTLFLYTDGVTEARRGRDFYGTERLAAFLGTLRDNDPRLVPSAVFRAVEEYASGRLRDDIAMLAIRRVPEPTERVTDEAALPATRLVRDAGRDPRLGERPRLDVERL